MCETEGEKKESCGCFLGQTDRDETRREFPITTHSVTAKRGGRIDVDCGWIVQWRGGKGRMIEAESHLELSNQLDV